MSANLYKYCPKVSIVIPAYNASNYLAEAIESALGQTYQNIEIIVINDGSKDDGATERIARSYGDRIVYVEKENGGSSSALNTGIRTMTGEWFSWLSHDDLYYPEKIEKQIEYLNNLDHSIEKISDNVLFSASELIDRGRNVIKKSKLKNERKMSYHISQITNNCMLICEPTVYTFHGCSCLVHKNVFEKINAFDEKLRLLNDVDMWYRIYAAGYKIHYLPDVLVQGRVHEKQVSRSIGFSYHNPEQDMYWLRSFNWLKENCPDACELFVKYGCNAYMKTRNEDGAKAFEYARSINKKVTMELWFRKIYCVCFAKVRTFAKNVYIKLRMDK